MLAEATTTEISKKEKPHTFEKIKRLQSVAEALREMLVKKLKRRRANLLYLPKMLLIFRGLLLI
jgi:hypothetical protein